MKSTLYASASAVCVLLMGTATPAVAQASAGAGNADDGAAIVVTARRVEERLQDVPISITVFNQEQLNARNVVNAADLATYAPSLSANSNFGNENTTFAIRGFTQEIGTAPSVGVYFADVITPRGASNGLPTGDGLVPGTLFDLQNVQVLKGPQGTLFGRNTTGGAVVVVPKKPTYELEGYVEGSIGNFDMRRVQAVANIPLAETFRVRLGLDRMVRDGFLRNGSGIGAKDFGDVNYWGARLSIVGDLTPNLENYTIFTYNHSDTNGPVQKLVGANPSQGLGGIFASQFARQGTGFYNILQNLPNSYSRLDQWQVINTTTWQASDSLTIKNIASYGELKQTINAPLFGTDALIDFGAINPALAFLGSYHIPFSSINNPPNMPSAHESTFTNELQVQGRSGNDQFTWQAGGYVELANPLSDAGSQSSFLAACTNVQAFQCTDPIGFLTFLGTGFPANVGTINRTIGRTSFRDFAAYAQGTYAITDQLKVTAGARYTWDRQRNISDQQVFNLAYPPAYGTISSRCTKPEAVATGCVSTYAQRTSAPTWTVDLEYKPTDDVMAYLKYSRGYRAGTIAPNISDPLNYVAAEKVDTYEAGLKGSFGGAVRGTFSAAGFYNDFTNQQIQVGFNAIQGSGQASTAAPFNVPKSEIWGFEVDGTISPFDGLDLQASYTYLRTKIKEVRDLTGFSDPNFDISPSFRVGDPNPLSPRHRLLLAATYTLPLDESFGRLSFGAVYTYRSAMLVNYQDRGNPDPRIAQFGTLPELSLWNLNATWAGVAGTPIDASAFVTNLTNKKYYAFAPGLGAAQVGFETAVVGEPRMYGVRLRFKFGT